MDALEAHVRGFWDGHDIDVVTWQKGRRLPEFRTYRVALEPGWVYVTAGSAHGTEFVLTSPVATELHAETLAMVSHFDRDHPREIGSTMNIGRPWLPGSRLDHLLVSLPYPYGPGLENGPGARFLWLLPIHREEAAFVAEHGLEELERRLEAVPVDIFAEDRDPVV